MPQLFSVSRYASAPSTRREIRGRMALVLVLSALVGCRHTDDGSARPAIAGANDSTTSAATWHSYYGAQVQREIQDMVRYDLTMDRVERFARASDNLVAVTTSTAHPARITAPTARDLERHGGLMGYAAAEYDWDPQQRGAIERAGLKTWEFVTLIFVLANTHDESVRVAGNGATRALASPNNLAFYAAHRAEIERLVPNLWRPSGTSTGEVR